MLRQVLTLFGVLATAGCHTFQPAGVSDLEPGHAVRARVTGAFSDSLSQILGRDDTRVIDGVVVEERASSTLIDVPAVTSLRGIRLETLSQRVEVPNEEILEIEIKVLDRGRTLAVAGVAGLVVGAFVVRQLNRNAGGGQLPGTGGPQDAIVSRSFLVIPLRSLAFLIGR